MFDLNFMAELYMPLVLAFCLIVGYILKHWIKDVDNKLIPTILAILGAFCACATTRAITLELVVGGALSGLASTGLHQVFKNLINKENK